MINEPLSNQWSGYICKAINLTLSLHYIMMLGSLCTVSIVMGATDQEVLAGKFTHTFHSGLYYCLFLLHFLFERGSVRVFLFPFSSSLSSIFPFLTKGFWHYCDPGCHGYHWLSFFIFF